MRPLGSPLLFARPHEGNPNPMEGFSFANSANFYERIPEQPSLLFLDDDEEQEPFDQFNIEFQDGHPLDREFFEVLKVDQGTVEAFFEVCRKWPEAAKRKTIIAAKHNCFFCFGSGWIDIFDLELYGEHDAPEGDHRTMVIAGETQRYQIWETIPSVPSSPESKPTDVEPPWRA